MSLVRGVAVLFLVVGQGLMAGLDEMWAKFTLSEEEERGAEVSQ